MHFNPHFSTVQILWTLTFASLLVLEVVLLGRDRTKRFPWFTAATAWLAVRLLTNRLLQGRLPEIPFYAVAIVMADVGALLALLVAAEMARRAFGRVSRRAWIAWGLGLLAASAVAMALWGPWPAWKTLSFDTPLAKLGLLQLLAQKTELLADLLDIGLGLLVVTVGWRYRAGWRSHVQGILVGLSTASLSQIGTQVIWQVIVRTTPMPHSRAEYEHVVNLREKLYNANSVVFLVVVAWWIWRLWVDEPGGAEPAAEATAEPAALPGPGEMPAGGETAEESERPEAG